MSKLNYVEIKICQVSDVFEFVPVELVLEIATHFFIIWYQAVLYVMKGAKAQIM
jgi:hypothetical protein